jgi:hypothetical protein
MGLLYCHSSLPHKPVKTTWAASCGALYVEGRAGDLLKRITVMDPRGLISYIPLLAPLAEGDEARGPLQDRFLRHQRRDYSPR